MIAKNNAPSGRPNPTAQPPMPAALPVKLVVAYVLLAPTWVLVSDWLCYWFLARPSEPNLTFEIARAMFVITCAAGLGWLVQRHLVRLLKAKEVLIRDEAHFRTLYEAAPVAYQALDEDDRLQEVNQTWLRLLGYDRQEVIGRSFVTLLAPGQQEEFRDNWCRLRTTGAAGVMEFDLGCKDGRFVCVSLHGQAIFGADGRFQRTHCLLWDITERRQHLQDMERLNRLYAALSQVNQAVVRSRSRPEVFERVCRAVLSYGGFKAAWVGLLNPETRRVEPVACCGELAAELTKFKIVVAEQPEGCGPTGTAIREGRTVIANQFRSDPTTKPWHELARELEIGSAASFPIRLGEAVCGALILYAREPDFFQKRELLLLEEAASDVSFALGVLEGERQRHQTEEALRASVHQLEESRRIARLGTYEFDVAADRWSSSPILDDIFGLTKEAFTYDRSGWLDTIHPLDRDNMRQYFQDEVLGQRKRFDKEYRIRQRNTQQLRWVHGLGELIQDADGRVTRMIGTIQDVTERKQAEEALQQSEARHRFLAEHITDVVWLLNATTMRFEYVSPSVERLRGFRSEEVLAATLAETISPKYWVAFNENLTLRCQAARHGDPFVASDRHEIQQTRRDGGLVWTELVTTLVGSPAAGLFILGVSRDITKRKKAEEALCQQEARLSSIFKALPSGVGVARNRIMTEVNDRICEMSGYTLEELLGQPTRILYASDEDYLRAGQELYHHAQDRPIGSAESRWKRKNGELYDVLIHSSRLDPLVAMTITFTVTDITEAKRAETKIRTLSQAIEQSPVSVMITDPKGRIEYVNRRFTQVTGYKSEEVLGRNPRFLKSGDTSREEYGDIWRTIKTGGEWRGQFKNRKKNGDCFWELSSISPIRDERGIITHFLSVREDITERKAASERIQAQAALLDQTRDAILVVDLERRIKYWNQSAGCCYPQLGAGRSDLLADDVLFAGELALCGEACRLTTEKGEWAGEIRRRTEAGIRTIQSRWTLVRNQSGQARNFLVVTTDITEKKRLEEQCLRSQRMESIGTLASGVAHDLNNILAPIMLSVDFLRQHDRDAQHASMLQMLAEGTQRGAGIVRQLLMFGRGMEGQRAEFNPRQLLKEMVKVIGETFPKSIRLEQQFANQLWSIHADATQIHQVLLNLCVNARDAMPKGGRLSITVENLMLESHFAALNPDAKPGPYVVFEVGDTGTGIPPALLDKIFDPFFTTKETGKGTGLGLSTVIGIVKSHGGFMRVTSRVGIGSQFKVYIPATESNETRFIEKSAGPAPRGKSELILVVDDEPAVRVVVEHTLKSNGYRVVTAGNGSEAVVALAQHRGEIRMVITDMSMPILDGATLIQIIRNQSPEIFIVAMSGLPVGEPSETDPATLADLFIPKPFVAEKLLAAVSAALEGTFSADQNCSRMAGDGSVLPTKAGHSSYAI